MGLLLLVAQLLLAAVFLVAGVAKLADLAGSRQALRDFGVPAALAPSGGVQLPLAELAVALVGTICRHCGHYTPDEPPAHERDGQRLRAATPEEQERCRQAR